MKSELIVRNPSFIVSEYFNKNNTICVQIKCPICGTISFFDNMRVHGYNKWKRGCAIKTVWPRSSKTCVEKFTSGKCDKCQDDHL